MQDSCSVSSFNIATLSKSTQNPTEVYSVFSTREVFLGHGQTGLAGSLWQQPKIEQPGKEWLGVSSHHMPQGTLSPETAILTWTVTSMGGALPCHSLWPSKWLEWQSWIAPTGKAG